MRGRASTDPVLTPPRIDFSTGTPRSGDYDDVYHAEAGALAQAEHVFLGGNGLPARWDGRDQFAILETGFGLGHNFLATWQAWNARNGQRSTGARTATEPPAQPGPTTPGATDGWLDFVAVESHPPSRDDLVRAHALSGAPADLAARLAEAWPEPLRGLHRLRFADGRIRLTLAFGDVGDVLPALVGRFDAFYLDGFAPQRNPAMWDPRLMKSLARLAGGGATLATWSVARGVRDGLAAAGFEVRQAPGFGRKHSMTVAHFAPRAPVRTPAGRPQGPWAGRREAVIVGAGLAGAAVARALAERGWRCTVLEGAEGPARGASGNPAGLFHGVVHGADGIHARLHRTAALLAARHYTPLIRQGHVPGAVDGLLVVQPSGTGDGRIPPSLEGYAEWLDADQARTQAGLERLAGPAMHYPQGGWIAPDALVRYSLTHPAIDLVTGVEVAGFEPPGQPGDDGTLTDADGRVVARAPVIVLACGPGLLRWSDPGLIDGPTLGMSAGRVSWFSSEDPGPRVPVSGHGYALRLPDGRVLCGATSRPPQDSATAEDDHRWNLQRLARLTGLTPSTPVDGRLGWRVGCADRLPVIGALPAAAVVRHPGGRSAHETRTVPGLQAQPRHIPRMPGLFIAGGFGSRGLVWAPLAGELIASWIEGTPLPLESDLVDAIDPARARSRRVRQGRREEPSDAGPQAEAFGVSDRVAVSAEGSAPASVPGSTGEPTSP